jgi:multiple sugar transport system substrate-binding protein
MSDRGLFHGVVPSVTGGGSSNDRPIASRRTILKGASAFLGLAAVPDLLAACSTEASGPESGSKTAKISVGSNYSDAASKAAFAATVSRYRSGGGGPVAVNTIDHNSFQNNIQNYLAGTPNNVFTWFAGYRTQFFAEQGLLTPVDDVWEDLEPHFSEATQQLSKGTDGHYYLVPWTSYAYAMFYKKSIFSNHGYTVPKTWDDLISLCKNMKQDGFATPIAIGQKDGWPAMATFDIIDMRLNGYEFHQELMQHKRSWTDPKVKQVFEHWAELTQYSTPGAPGRTYQEAVQIFDASKDSAMIFLGTKQVIPEVNQERLDDLDFFPFPQITPDYPPQSAIDAPTDGFLMSKNIDGQGKASAAFLRFLGTANAEGVFLESNPSSVGASSDYDSSTYTRLQRRTSELIQSTDNIAQFLDRDTRPDFAYPIVQNALNTFLNNPRDIDGVTQQLEAQAKAIFAA